MEARMKQLSRLSGGAGLSSCPQHTIIEQIQKNSGTAISHGHEETEAILEHYRQERKNKK
jgi:hypothetical protein